jgi:hypothetical protein
LQRQLGGALGWQAGLNDDGVGPVSIHRGESALADLLREFENEPRALMTNARCLTEGVDVPAIDCVVAPVAPTDRFSDMTPQRPDCVAGLRRLELRYPCASRVFEMS